MIEAFEAGVPLTAHGCLSDVQATIAGRCADLALLEGLAIAVSPEIAAPFAMPREDGAAPVAAGSRAADPGDGTATSLWMLMAASRAKERSGEPETAFRNALPAAETVPSGVAASVLPPGVQEFLVTHTGAVFANDVSGDGAARLRPPQEGPAAVRRTELSGWTRDTVPPGVAATDLRAGLAPARVARTSPWASSDRFQDDRRETAASGLDAPGALTAVLGRNEAGGSRSAIALDARLAPMTIGQMMTGIRADIASALPVSGGDCGPASSMPRLAALLAPLPEDFERLGTAPSFGDLPAGRTARWMVPPIMTGEASRAEGASHVPLLAAAAPVPATAESRPIVVHATVHLDGSTIAHAVSEHIVAGMNGPLGGTGGFDPRRSYTPVEG